MRGHIPADRIASQVQAVLDDGAAGAPPPRRDRDAEDVAHTFDELNRLVLAGLGSPGDFVEGAEPARQ